MSQPETAGLSPVELARGLGQDRPFGDSSYIQSQMHAAFFRRLDTISTAVPVAGELLAALTGADDASRYRALGDPVLRFVIQQALARLRTEATDGYPEADCARVLEGAVEHLARADSGTWGPLVAEAKTCERLGPNPFHGWIWNGDSGTEGVFRGAFLEQITRNTYDPVCGPDSRQTAALQAGAELLDNVAPGLSESSLAHAHVIAVFPQKGRWKGVVSSSQFRVPGAIFLSRNSLENPWVVAEGLFHESLHQKSYDLRHAHTVQRSDFDPAEDTEATSGITSLWNRVDANGPEMWGPSRGLAAFHVYTHLAVYAALAHAARQQDDTLPPGGDDPRVTTAEVARRRALYLGDQLRRYFMDVFGRAGVGLVDWLTQCMDLMAAPLPESELRASLLLQRYGREIGSIQNFLGRTPLPPQQELLLLLGDEVAAARRILTMCDPPALSDFEGAIRPYLAADGQSLCADVAPLVRRLIRDALNSVLPDGAPDENLPEVHQGVEAMVERSSRDLVTILAKPSESTPAVVNDRAPVSVS